LKNTDWPIGFQKSRKTVSVTQSSAPDLEAAIGAAATADVGLFSSQQGSSRVFVHLAKRLDEGVWN
jgi:hypothetical protein